MVRKLSVNFAVIAMTIAAAGCNNETLKPVDVPTPGITDPIDVPGVTEVEPVLDPVTGAEIPFEPEQELPGAPIEPDALKGRVRDYSEALRTASIKLIGTLPTMDEVASVRDRATYEAQIDRYLADPRFTRQMVSYFRDMMKMGGTLDVQVGEERVSVSLETAPTFAAQLVSEDRPLTDMFTATTNTCPTFDAGSNTIVAGACTLTNGIQPAGVLTDPGAMAQFYSNLAFRRVRWVQETFDCTRFPAEYVETPTPIGNGAYSAPWPFESISGELNGGIVNFHDASSVVCANCHATMNHVAPLFANFDAAGRFQTSIQVMTPLVEARLSILADWLPAPENYGWRFGEPVTNMRGLGQAMARDPNVMRCQISRAWNWAMSKSDIVEDNTIVPASTTQTLEDSFTASGFRMKSLVRAIFTHDDFVKF